MWGLVRIVRLRQQAGELTIMPHTIDPSRDLLFGLLALQTGLINQAQLVAAFHLWTLASDRPMSTILAELGALDTPCLALVEKLVIEHLRRHGNDPERSLAAVGVGRSTRECLAQIGNPDLNTSLAHAGLGSTEDESDSDRTPRYSIGTATSDGQRFRVLRPHAQGGLGAVFVALDTELHREVALKQILDDHADDPASRQRFLVEAEITGGLEHPGIVPVYGLGNYGDGRPYYAMRFIRGDSLKEAIERFRADAALQTDPGRRSLELRKLLRRFIDVCNAVDYAHSRGVLHRDIKPGNVMVGKYGETLIVDWGLAKPTGQSDPDSDERTLRPSSAGLSAETLPGSALGTPAYMSPEQAEGALDRLGPRSDVYSLGATLYSLLTGRPPFAGKPWEVLRAVPRGEFPPPRAVVPNIDRALEAVCLKAMALRPEDRYDSCRALVEDIERWVADEPVSAWREPWEQQARRWARRNRTAVVAATVALIAGVVGLGAVAGVQAQANRTLIKANKATEKALAETQEAKKATEAALVQSEESRRQAKAINEFLTEDLLSQAEPANTAAEDHVSLLDVLDRAAAKVGDRFAGQPEVEDSLRRTIARTYHGLASWEKAERQWRAALDAAHRRHGPESSEYFAALSQVAHILRHRGRVDVDTLAMAKSASDGLARVLGPDHLDTLDSRNELALAYQEAGRMAEAITLHEATLKLFESKLGPDNPDTLLVRNNLGAAYLYAGRTADAVTLHEATLKLFESKLGPNHPGTLLSRHNVGVAYLQAGRTADAITVLEATLKLRVPHLGPDHPDTLQSRVNLGVAYLYSGRTADAVTVLEATLKPLESQLGPEHPSTLINRGNLARAYRAAGQADRAVPILEQVLQGFRANVGPDHPYTRTAELLLADAYAGAVEQARKQFGPADLRTAAALAQLGRNLIQQRNWAAAEPLLRECLAIQAKAQPDDWSAFNTRSQLGGSLLGLGRYADAELLILAGYEGLKAREAKIPAPDKARLPEAAERVLKLYEAWGKTDQATMWKAKLAMPELPTDVFARP
jgi:eukaryotic-like serine/threonine-protein kinase